MSAGEAVNPPRHRWFLKLYPREWRERYGDELAELVGDRPLSLGGSIDLIAGAIDARFTKGAKMPHVFKSACLTRGESPTTTESLRAAVIMVVMSLILVSAGTAARRNGSPQLAQFFVGISFPASLAVMSHFLYLRKQSVAVKWIITGGSLTILLVISLINAL